MHKKILAILIAGTMVISSASAVMASEPDKRGVLILSDIVRN